MIPARSSDTPCTLDLMTRWPSRVCVGRRFDWRWARAAVVLAGVALVGCWPSSGQRPGLLEPAEREAAVRLAESMAAARDKADRAGAQRLAAETYVLGLDKQEEAQAALKAQDLVLAQRRFREAGAAFEKAGQEALERADAERRAAEQARTATAQARTQADQERDVKRLAASLYQEALANENDGRAALAQGQYLVATRRFQAAQETYKKALQAVLGRKAVTAAEAWRERESLVLKQAVGQPALPEFPWPPPRWTSRYVIPSGLVVASPTQTVGNMFDLIKAALARAKIEDWSVYDVDRGDGLAIVTRLESIEHDGRSKQGPTRWDTRSSATSPSKLSEYLRGLFTARPGHYRVIVLILTTRPVVPASEVPTASGMQGLAKGGAGAPPLGVWETTLTPSFRCEALIYEFIRPSPDDSVRWIDVSQLMPTQHLAGAGLWRLEELR